MIAPWLINQTALSRRILQRLPKLGELCFPISTVQLERLFIQLVADVALLMNKSEAMAVLHELYEALKESVCISSVSLDGSQVSHISTGGYQIKMKCELDSSSRDIVKGIAKKRSLTMKEQDGYVILRSFRD